MKTVADVDVLRSFRKKGRNDIHNDFIRYMLVIWPEIQRMQNVVIRAEKFHPSERYSSQFHQFVNVQMLKGSDKNILREEPETISGTTCSQSRPFDSEMRFPRRWRG